MLFCAGFEFSSSSLSLRVSCLSCFFVLVSRQVIGYGCVLIGWLTERVHRDFCQRIEYYLGSQFSILSTIGKVAGSVPVWEDSPNGCIYTAADAGVEMT